jgi:hypothetical protein
MVKQPVPYSVSRSGRNDICESNFFSDEAVAGPTEAWDLTYHVTSIETYRKNTGGTAPSMNTWKVPLPPATTWKNIVPDSAPVS